MIFAVDPPLAKPRIDQGELEAGNLGGADSPPENVDDVASLLGTWISCHSGLMRFLQQVVKPGT